jgi:hypothetical protein
MLRPSPYARALAHPKLSKAVKKRLRELYRSLDPVALLAEIRDAQTVRSSISCVCFRISITCGWNSSRVFCAYLR